MSKDIDEIGTAALAIMATKAMMILPGLPISPGHKNIAIIPVLFLPQMRDIIVSVRQKWVLVVGILNFMLGYGKLGPPNLTVCASGHGD